MTAPTVHINTLRKRKRASAAADLMAAVKQAQREGVVAGYALIVFTEDGRARCRFDTGGLMPLWAFPGAVEFVTRNAVMEGVEEDYQRPVGATPWPQGRKRGDP